MRNGKSYSEAGKLGAIASLKTHNELKRKRVEEYNLNPVKCKACGNALDYEHRHNKFCSHSCSASFNNIGVVRNGSPKQKNIKALKSQKIDLYCKFCNIKLIKNQKLFCSSKCKQNFYWQERKKKIEETGFFQRMFGNEARRSIVKKYLVEKYGHKCSICGITEWMGKEVPLVVDHIDGNAENCSVDNFRLVCGNCDMQLPTYKSKNKFGRAWRRKYNK